MAGRATLQRIADLRRRTQGSSEEDLAPEDTTQQRGNNAETARISGTLQGTVRRQEEQTDRRERRSTDSQEGQEDKAKLETHHLEEARVADRHGDREGEKSTVHKQTGQIGHSLRS